MLAANRSTNIRRDRHLLQPADDNKKPDEHHQKRAGPGGGCLANLRDILVHGVRPVQCSSGGRATLAARQLKDIGFTNVTAVVMELADWQKREYPFAKDKSK